MCSTQSIQNASKRITDSIATRPAKLSENSNQNILSLLNPTITTIEKHHPTTKTDYFKSSFSIYSGFFTNLNIKHIDQHINFWSTVIPKQSQSHSFILYEGNINSFRKETELRSQLWIVDLTITKNKSRNLTIYETKNSIFEQVKNKINKNTYRQTQHRKSSGMSSSSISSSGLFSW